MCGVRWQGMMLLRVTRRCVMSPPRRRGVIHSQEEPAMRRLVTLVALVILAIPLLSAAGIGAQEASPAASVALPPLLQQASETFNSGDAAAVAALYAEDGIHEDIPAGVRTQGREEITAYVAEVFGQLNDFRFEPIFGRLENDLAVLEYTLTGTDPNSGRSVSYQGVIVAEYEGDLIRRSTDYYDLATILNQLGLLDLGEGTAEATPAP
jgi:steroid delta-isomerase-like uncharacterized protein